MSDTEAGEYLLFTFYYLYKEIETETRWNNYNCTLIETINTFRMLLILSIKSKNIFKTYSHSIGEWSLIIRYTALSLKAFSSCLCGLCSKGAYGSKCRLMKDTVLDFFLFSFCQFKTEIMKKLAIRVRQ